MSGGHRRLKLYVDRKRFTHGRVRGFSMDDRHLTRNQEASMAANLPPSTIWLYVPSGLLVEPELIATLLASAIALSANAAPDTEDRGAAHEPLRPWRIEQRG
jgi:hypothetical protein